MKRIFILALSLLFISANTSFAAPTGSVVSCANIATDSSKTKGTSLACLAGGKPVLLESIKGPAIINVWGSWCIPCRQEMPHFAALAKLKKVTIIGIDVEEANLAAGKNFVLAHGMNWPILFDPDGRTKSAFGMGVPVTWFLNNKSVIVYRQIGIINSDQLLFNEVSKYLKIKI